MPVGNNSTVAKPSSRLRELERCSLGQTRNVVASVNCVGSGKMPTGAALVTPPQFTFALKICKASSSIVSQNANRHS
jgi:hypothetical protein